MAVRRLLRGVVSPKSTQERRRKLFVQGLQKFIDCSFDLVEATRLVSSTFRVLPSVVTESLRPYAGAVLTRKDIVSLCWLLGGNVDKLKASQVVRPWVAQSVVEWMAVEVLELRHVVVRRDSKVQVDFKILSGSGSGLVVQRIFSPKSLRYFAHVVGFSRKYAYRNFRNLHGFLLYGKFEPQHTRDDLPNFREIGATAYTVKYNRQKLEVRCRLKPCPLRYTHACHSCALGVDRCEFATRPVTLEQGFCPNCASPDGLFDPRFRSVICMACSKSL